MADAGIRRVLVTGGAGFVGANLVRRLIGDGHDVHLALRASSPTWRLDELAGRFTPHHIDLGDPTAVRAVLADLRPQWIFHLATYGAYPNQNNFDLALQTNVVMTTGLVHAALEVGFESFIVAGSSSEYGTKDHPPGEVEGLDPISYYAATKAAATVLCRQLAASYSANLVILRLYSVYGPFEEPRRLIPAIIRESWGNHLPALVGPETAHDFVFVTDVVEAFVLCAERSDHAPGAIYNVSSGTQLTLREVVEVGRDVLHVTAEPDWGSMPGRPWDTAIWQGDSSLLRLATGWQAVHPFRAGLSLTADWFQARPEMRERYEAAQDHRHG